MYTAYGLLQPDSDFTLAEAEKRLLAQFPGAASQTTDDLLTITAGEWDLYLRVNEGPEVRSEASGFAARIAGIEDAGPFLSCKRRVEVWSETPDPFLEHFEKYQQVIGVLRSFNGLIAVDPKEPALL
jgi:hypothetical protein